MDSFFKQRFNGAKCKTLLKLTIPRIKLLRNRREIQIKQMRRDIAKLLETGQEATARIRVEHIIREENMMAAQEVIELFCELIAVRLPIIETQRECPLDLKEAISSVCFAAPRCADLPELQQVQMLFASKYGKEFVAAASELMPDCGVNRQIIELLSIRAPPAEAKLKLLKEIAEEHELDWDPAASETELYKPHEDLLNGPTQFVSGSKLPLPKEKHDESLSSGPDKALNEQINSDEGFDTLDFPEVPKVSLRPLANAVSAPEMVSSAVTGSPDPGIDAHIVKDSGFDHHIGKDSSDIKNPSSVPYLEVEEVVPETLVASSCEPANASVGAKEDKKFVPFISPPQSSASISVGQSNPAPPVSRTKSDVSLDFQDVLSAANAAAETAERAAAAARSAASLAQVRIAELVKKRNDQVSDNNENLLQREIPNQSPGTEMAHLDHQSSGMSNPWYDTPKVGTESHHSGVGDIGHQGSIHHKPQRLHSLEDDPYFSYPNLFSSKDTSHGSDIHSASESFRSTKEH